MTTKELESKLKISKNTCIHCPTFELAKQVLSIFHQLGLKWHNETDYKKNPNWDDYKENTVYYPFKGQFSGIKYAQQNDYKIISAEKFIALHTEDEEFDLENYKPKGELEGFPKEIIARMLDCQEEQGNKRDVTVFEKNIIIGFTWDDTKEGGCFWYEVIIRENFDLFFDKYPKQDNQDNSQKFKVGDEVIDIISGRRGKVTYIDALNTDSSPIFVDFNDDEGVYLTLNGRDYDTDKHPRLLHYRDDYNYDVIDFNNLPKRQESKRGGYYYFIKRDEHDFNLDKIYKTMDYYNHFSDELYKIGNYFQTKEQAQEVADKLNEYFKQLINK